MQEFGSPVDIIIKTKAELDIAGKHYMPNQVYTILREVDVEFQYEKIQTDVAAKKIIYRGDIKSYPNAFQIWNLPLSQKIIDLIFNETTSGYLTQVENLEVIDGTLYLKYAPARNLIILNDNGQQVEESTYTINNDTIIIANGTYTVMYEYLATGKTYNLESPFYPYFAAEIIGLGNTDKQTNKIHLVLPTIKISQTPRLQFTNTGVCSTPMVCDIIYQNQPEPYLVID